jgi:atypical dual specificity phosphatase
VEEWQAKRGTPAGGQRLTTAFLDGTHPVVDVYELKVGGWGVGGAAWMCTS